MSDEAAKTPPEQPAKRRRGAPKGRPKPPGSGRKKKVQNWTAPEVRERLLPVTAEKIQKIISGERVQVSGPTGKAKWVYPTVDQQLKAAEIALRKTMPDLSATQIQAQVEDITPEKRHPRDVGRAILSILAKAKLPDDSAEPAPESPQPPQKLIGRDPIIEVNGSSNTSPGCRGSDEVSEASTNAPDGAASADAVAPLPDAPKDSERVYLHENGAEIVWAADRRIWQVFDASGMEHHGKRTKAEALAFAEGLPAPSLKAHPGRDQPRQPDPTDYAAPGARRDEMPFADHRAPRVMRRRPR